MRKIKLILLALWVSFSLYSQMVTTYEGKLGHTVAFNVASFTDVRDKTLEDIIHKLPGVKYDTRTFTYNGMQVTKIYVDESDTRSSFMLVAGLKPEEIDKIEFIENFQAVKVLQNKQYSSMAAMNIILKKGIGSNWSGKAKVGSGWTPTLYNADIYTIRLGKKSQSMFNFMANNTGQDLNSLVSKFVPDDIGLTAGRFKLASYIDISGVKTPLADDRTRFNDSYMFSMVNTFKLSDKFQLYTQGSYLYEKNRSEMFTEVEYYFKDGTVVETNSGEYASKKFNEVKGTLALISNSDKYYLVDQLFTEVNCRHIGNEMTGTYPNSQAGKLSSLNVKNDLRYLRPIGNWLLTVYSQNQIQSIPQNIGIRRVGSSQYQDIHSTVLFSDTKASFGYTFNGWTVTMDEGLDVLSRTLESDFDGVDSVDVKNNNAKFGYIHAFVQPTVNYVSSHLQMRAGLPFKYYHYTFHEHSTKESSQKDITNFEPLLSIKYMVNPLLSFTLNGKVQYDLVDVGSFYTGMILTNYRNIKQGSLKYNLDNEHSLDLSYSYKLPKYSYFMNGMIRYMVAKSKFSTFDTFVGDYVLKGLLPQQTDAKVKYSDMTISKGIDALKGTIGISCNYRIIERKMIRNNQLVKYNTNIFSIGPSINGRLTKWMKVDYKFEQNNIQMKISGSDTKSHTNRYNQRLEMILTPTDKVNFSMLGEHYHASITGEKAMNLFLADVKAEYQFTKQWQFIASITNILNQADYSFTNIDNLTQTRTSYKIRPRNVLLSLYYKF